MFSTFWSQATEETVKEAMANGAKSFSLKGLLTSGIGCLTSLGGRVRGSKGGFIFFRNNRIEQDRLSCSICDALLY